MTPAYCAGFYAAHGIYSVMDGSVRCPFLGLFTPAGRPRLKIFEGNDYEVDAQRALSALLKRRKRRYPAVAVYDGYYSGSRGRTDALILEARDGPDPESHFSVVVPYRNAESQAGFAVYRPVFKLTAQQQSRLVALSTEFFDGVEAHERGNMVWMKYLEEHSQVPPSSALQRAALGIKCLAAGGRAPSAHQRRRARVLQCHLAVAELGS